MFAQELLSSSLPQNRLPPQLPLMRGFGAHKNFRLPVVGAICYRVKIKNDIFTLKTPVILHGETFEVGINRNTKTTSVSFMILVLKQQQLTVL